LSWIRSPLLHFLSIGMALFVADGLREALVPFTRFATFAPFLPLATEQDPAPLQIEIDAARLDMLEQGFVTQMGRAPDPDESVRLLAAEVDEEILYREALARGLLERDGGVQTRLIQKMLFLDGAAGIENAGELLRRAKQLGLDQDDIVVRRILVQKMRLFGSTLEESERPSWESIAARYAQTREAFREPDRISFVQVFLSADERLGATQGDAEALRRRLLDGSIGDEAAISLGDPFPLGHRFSRRSERDLTRSFGSAFGAQALELSPGRWSQPIESAYGRHLLRVQSRKPGQIPDLEAVADRIRRDLERELRDAKLKTLLRDLRKRYEVVVIDASKELG